MSSLDFNSHILQPTRLPVRRNLFKETKFGEPGTVETYCRHIPIRAHNTWGTSFAIIPDPVRGTTPGKKSRETGESPRDSSAYSCLLKNELLGENIEDVKLQCDDRQALTPIKSKNLFKYSTPLKVGDAIYVLYLYKTYKILNNFSIYGFELKFVFF